MPTYSGNIGDLISFDVESAGSVTGVSFGAGKADLFQAQPNNITLNARVPEEANWGYVTFDKGNTTAVYDAVGTGLRETGALYDLGTNLSASGWLGTCASGAPIYSNLYEALNICHLTATGVTEYAASGRFYDAYGSGLCGDDFDASYSSSGYSATTTRVHNFNTLVDNSENWLAVGNIQDTGNFAYQKASLEVTCVTPEQESTDYKFVPIPVVSTFNPKEGQEGGPLLIYGNVFADVSAVDISGLAVSFSIVDDSTISGTIPAGVFNNEIRLTGPSGVKAYSSDKFASLGDLSTEPEDKSLQIFENQLIKKPKGYPFLITILGKNITGLSIAALIDESNTFINLITNSDFSYTSSNMRVPVSGLEEGFYNLTARGPYLSYNPLNSVTVENIINIIDAPFISYSFKNILTTGFIYEPEIYASEEDLEQDLGEKEYLFNLGERANKICLSFNNENIEGGSVKYELERDLGNNSNTISIYYITASGQTEAVSRQRALDMFNSGIYTRDWYGEPFGEYSEKLNTCTCSIISSGSDGASLSFPDFIQSRLVTGTLTGNLADHPVVAPLIESCRTDFSGHAEERKDEVTCIESGFTYTSGVVGSTDYDEVNLTASGYTTGQNITNILQQLQSYPGYEITQWGHGSDSTAHQIRSYASGISHPYPTVLLNDHSSGPWENILHSGIANITSLLGDQVGLVSGYDIINSTNLNPAGSLTGIGRGEASAKSKLEYVLSTGYSQCATGNYSTSTVHTLTSVTGSGIMYGYC